MHTIVELKNGLIKFLSFYINDHSLSNAIFEGDLNMKIFFYQKIKVQKPHRKLIFSKSE